MAGVQGEHHLTQEPQIYLNIQGDPFSLFYDYDQTRDKKLSALSPREKARWLQARIDLIFLEPLRQCWNISSGLFRTLMVASTDRERHCSFSIAVMVTMLNGVESLGGFLNNAQVNFGVL